MNRFHNVVIILAMGFSAIFFLYGSLPAGAKDYQNPNSTSVGMKTEPIYVSIFTHNEEDDPYWLELRDDRKKYLDYRAYLIAKVKMVRQYGAIINWQSDHVVLEAMEKFENGDLLKETNGKTVMRWMVEDMGMKVDPHGHLSQYNYADLAYLMQKMGGGNSGVMGGFALFQVGRSGKLEQIDFLKTLDIGTDGAIRGRKFPSSSWKPKIVVEGGMIGHGYDEYSSGVWRPQEHGDFLQNQPNGRFICIGTGFPFHSTIVGPREAAGPQVRYSNVEYIKELIDKIQAGTAPAGKIYTASIHSQDHEKKGSVAELQQTLKTLQPYVRNGQIVYQDFESVALIWRSRYQEQPNRYGIENFSIYGTLMKGLNEFINREKARGPVGQVIWPPPPGLPPPPPGGLPHPPARQPRLSLNGSAAGS